MTMACGAKVNAQWNKNSFCQYNSSMFFINVYFWPFYPVLLDLGRGKLKSKGNHSKLVFMYNLS